VRECFEGLRFGLLVVSVGVVEGSPLHPVRKACALSKSSNNDDDEDGRTKRRSCCEIVGVKIYLLQRGKSNFYTDKAGSKNGF
jgi:hypothetical protein